MTDKIDLVERMARAIQDALDLSDGLKLDMATEGQFSKAAEAALAALHDDPLGDGSDFGVTGEWWGVRDQRIAELEAALTPFAEAYYLNDCDDRPNPALEVPVCDLRRAANALKQGE